MKKVILNKIIFLIPLSIVMFSCSGLKKMKDLASNAKYEATPKVLEMNNGEVELTISGNFPPKYFNKNAVVTVTPIVKYEGGQIELQSKKLQGEKILGNEQVIAYEAGGSFSYSDKFAYKDEMMRSTVEVQVTATVKNNTENLGSYKVADGIIITPKLVRLEPKTIFLPDRFQRATPVTRSADILYDINKANIRPSELKKPEVKALTSYIDSLAKIPRYQIKGIEIASAASPDGPVKLNTDLSDSRSNSATKFLKEQGKKAKVNVLLSDSLLSVLKTPEDWEGFKELMEKSDIKDKDLVLRVLSMYSDPEVREREIRNIAEAFEEIKVKILPQLRRSKFIVKAEAIGYSDEELIQIAQTNADTLTLEEMLYAANLVKDFEQKAEIYKKASVKFPNDVRPKNNLGYVLILLGRYDEAKAALEEAKNIENNDAVKTNLGAVALLQGDLASAEELLTSAVAAGEAPNYNLGILNIIKGKYDIAVSYFGNACDYNAALAKLLNKNYEAAINTIGCSKDESAQAYYLKAVLGARTDNSDMVFNNLRTAVAKDIKLKAYAAKDVEFLKYFEDETFKSIIQ